MKTPTKAEENAAGNAPAFTPGLKTLEVGYCGHYYEPETGLPAPRFAASVYDPVTLRRFAHAYGETKQEAKANARLIAAAPELLASLERNAFAMEQVGREFERLGSPTLAYQCFERAKEARAAIAKAEGRA